MSDPTQGPTPEPAPRRITRRRFLQGGAMTAASAVALPALSKASGLRMRAGASKDSAHIVWGCSSSRASWQRLARSSTSSMRKAKRSLCSTCSRVGCHRSKMTAAFSSGDVPDLFQYYDAGLVPWAANGLLADLKKLMPTSTWTEVVPGTLSVLTTSSGGVIGLPFETETPLIYYRTDLLAKAGITPATSTTRWTWDQSALLRSKAQ